MSYHIDILSKAQYELFETWNWYEDKQPGLGKRFRQAFFDKAKLIQNDPLQYPVKNKLREAILSGFPFIIVYKMDKHSNTIYILSVFHMSRHPKRKRR